MTASDFFVPKQCLEMLTVLRRQSESGIFESQNIVSKASVVLILESMLGELEI